MGLMTDTPNASPDDEPVLTDVSLDIPAGSMVGISGRTGSGKSSLILTLLRLLLPSSGTVRIDGVDLATLPGDLVRASITTIPQDPYFPPRRSLRQSLSLSGREVDDVDIMKALRQVGLLPHIMAHLGSTPSAAAPAPAPEEDENDGDEALPGLEMTGHILGAEMRSLPLSAGQLQLFALAHAMLQRHHRIVLLDEVSSAMDGATEARFRAVLRSGETFRGRTVVMIAHRPEMLALCDIVVELDAGRVIRILQQ